MLAALLMTLLLETAVAAAQWVLLAKTVFSVTYERNVNLMKRENLRAFLILFASGLLFTMMLHPLGRPALLSSGSLATLWLVGTLLSSLACGYTTDFALYLDEEGPLTMERLRTQAGMDDYVWTPLRQCAKFSALLVAYAYATTIALALLLPFLRSSLLGLISIRAAVELAAAIFLQQLLVRLTAFGVKHAFVKKMLAFNLSFPSIYCSFDKPNGEFSLPTALYSDDPATRLFALYRLYRLCTESPQSRAQVYELSQPGNHPRNWNILKRVALLHIDVVRERQTAAGEGKSRKEAKPAASAARVPSALAFSPNNHIIDGGASSSPELRKREIQAKQQRLFLPPALNPRTATFARNRSSPSMLNFLRVPPVFYRCVDWLNGVLFAPAPAIPSYDLVCADYSKQALLFAIHYSLDEDVYGVVQTDEYGRAVLKRAMELARERVQDVSLTMGEEAAAAADGLVSMADVSAAIDEQKTTAKVTL